MRIGKDSSLLKEAMRGGSPKNKLRSWAAKFRAGASLQKVESGSSSNGEESDDASAFAEKSTREPDLSMELLQEIDELWPQAAAQFDAVTKDDADTRDFLSEEEEPSLLVDENDDDDDDEEETDDDAYFLPEGYLGRFRSFTEPLFQNVDWSLSPINEDGVEELVFNKDADSALDLDLKFTESQDAHSTKWIALHHEDLVLSTESVDRSVEISMDRLDSVGRALKISLQRQESVDTEDPILSVISTDLQFVDTPKLEEDGDVDVAPLLEETSDLDPPPELEERVVAMNSPFLSEKSVSGKTPPVLEESADLNRKSAVYHGEAFKTNVADTNRSADGSIEVDADEKGLVAETSTEQSSNYVENNVVRSNDQHIPDPDSQEKESTSLIGPLGENTASSGQMQNIERCPIFRPSSIESNQLKDEEQSVDVVNPTDLATPETQGWKRRKKEDYNNAWSLGRPPKLPLRKARRRASPRHSSLSSDQTKAKLFEEESISLSVSEDHSQIEISTVNENGNQLTEHVEVDVKDNEKQSASKLEILQTYEDKENGILWVALKPPESMEITTLEENLSIQVAKAEKTNFMSKSTVQNSTAHASDTNLSVDHLRNHIAVSQEETSLSSERKEGSKILDSRKDGIHQAEGYVSLWESLSNHVPDLSTSVEGILQANFLSNKPGQSLFHGVEHISSHPYTTELQRSASEFGKRVEKLATTETTADYPTDPVEQKARSMMQEIEKSVITTLSMISTGVAEFHTNFLSHRSPVSKTENTRDVKPRVDTGPSVKSSLTSKTSDIKPSSITEQRDDLSTPEPESLTSSAGDDIEILFSDDHSFCVLTGQDKTGIVHSLTDASTSSTGKVAKKQKSRKMFWRRGEKREASVTRP